MRAPPTYYYHLWGLGFQHMNLGVTHSDHGTLGGFHNLLMGDRFQFEKQCKNTLTPTEFFSARNTWTWGNGLIQLSFLIQSLFTMRNRTCCSKEKLTTDNKEKSVIQCTDEIVIGLLIHLLIGSEPFHDFYCPFYTGASHWFIGYIV